MPRKYVSHKDGPSKTVLAAKQVLETRDLEPKRRLKALEWCEEALNDPNIDKEFKLRLVSLMLPYQSPKVEHRIRSKEMKEAAAKTPEPTFVPSPLPEQLRVQ